MDSSLNLSTAAFMKINHLLGIMRPILEARPLRSVIPHRSSFCLPRGSSKTRAVDRLVEWVQGSGGYLHPSLGVVEEAPCGGGRGVVCLGPPLAIDEVQGMPMILLPEDLLLTAQVAR